VSTPAGCTATPAPERPVGPGEPLLDEERAVFARVAELDVDLAAMAVVANVWRAAQAARSELERRILRPHGISWGGFSLLFNLWVAGPEHPMEIRELAGVMSCSRPSVSSLCDTLQRAGLIARREGAQDRRLVEVSLTQAGQRTIADLFLAFNVGERALVAGLTSEQQHQLAGLLRSLVRSARDTHPPAPERP
jgi:DNA-binding MarR family transcriptional regulator